MSLQDGASLCSACESRSSVHGCTACRGGCEQELRPDDTDMAVWTGRRDWSARLHVLLDLPVLLAVMVCRLIIEAVLDFAQIGAAGFRLQLTAW